MKVMTSLIEGLRTVNRLIDFLFRNLAALVMVILLGTVLWAVFSRTVGIVAPWTDKVMLVFLPVLAFLVAPIAYRRGANVALDIVSDALPKRLQRLLSLAIHLFILLILLMALDLSLRKVGFRPTAIAAIIEGVAGVDLDVIRPFKAKIKIPVLGIEWRTVHFVMPVAFFTMILANIELLLRYAVGLADPDSKYVKPIRSFEDVASNVGS